MKRNLIAIIGVAAVVILILALKSRRPPRQENSGPANGAPAQSTSAGGFSNDSTSATSDGGPVQTGRIESAPPPSSRIIPEFKDEISKWQGPILYFGKVVDESGKPIEGVEVSYGANSMNQQRTEVYNTGTVTTDQRGIFEISGVRGVNLMVQLSHSNYYAYPENSTGFDKRSMPRKGYFSDGEEKAELFRMHRKGSGVPLVHRRGGVDVPVNTGTGTVEFYGGNEKELVGKLQIQAWGDTPKNWSSTPYDWSVRLTVPDGGLIESTNQFAFTAPEAGYRNIVEIVMSKEQDGWSDTVDKWYFVKLPRGYARLGIHMRAKTPVYVSLEYYFNPDGSRNLEPSR